VLFTAVGIRTDYNRSSWNPLWAVQTATDMGVPLLNLSADVKVSKDKLVQLLSSTCGLGKPLESGTYIQLCI